MKVSDYVIKFLEDIGINHIYGLSGGMIMHLLDSIGNNKNVNFIPFHHEQGACIASEGESIYKNDLAVCLTTAGPGILNTINPISSAFTDCNALLVIAGQCKVSDSMCGTGLRQKGVQEVNAVDILKPITKYSVSIKDKNLVRYYLEKAVYLATTGKKGTSFVEIPLDIQGEDIDETSLIGYNFLEETNVEENINKKVVKLIKYINKSKNPIILAGNGIRLSKGYDLFKDIISKLKIPVQLTWKTVDFLDENDPLNFGRPGSVSSRYANIILQNCDLLLCIGTRLDLPTVAYSYPNFAPNAKKIIVDIDKNEIEKLNFDLEFNTDAFNFLIMLKNNINNINININDWLNYCSNLKNKYPICLSEYYKENDFINPYVFLEELSKELLTEDIIVPSSSGSATEIPCQAFKIKEGQRFIHSNMIGSMGYAISHSIGVSFATNKEKRVICIEGDGSFQMNMSEIQLITQYKLPIKIFIFNNRGFNSIKNTQDKFFNSHYVGSTPESGVTFPELYKIANAFDIPYYKIKNNNEISIIKDLLKDNSYMIIEVFTNPNQKTVPRVESKVDINGKIISGKLEDMFPFLSEEELKSNMIRD